MKFNLDSALRTAVAAQGYHGISLKRMKRVNWPEAELVQDGPN